MGDEQRELDKEWRTLLFERIDEVANRIDKHLEKDEDFYAKVARLEFDATMAGRLIKFAATLAGALGIKEIYNFFKHGF